MKKIFITAAMALACISCEKQEHIPDATWNTIERISGRYILESVLIDSPSADIDNDGYPEQSLLPAILSQGYVGIQILDKNGSHIVPASGPGKTSNMCFYIIASQVKDFDIHDGKKPSMSIQCCTLNVEYTVDEKGTLKTKVIPDSYNEDFINYTSGPTLSFDTENQVTICYECKLFDYLTHKNKEVTVTCLFRNTTRQ